MFKVSVENVKTDKKFVHAAELSPGSLFYDNDGFLCLRAYGAYGGCIRLSQNHFYVSNKDDMEKSPSFNRCTTAQGDVELKVWLK